MRIMYQWSLSTESGVNVHQRWVIGPDLKEHTWFSLFNIH